MTLLKKRLAPILNVIPKKKKKYDVNDLLDLIDCSTSGWENDVFELCGGIHEASPLMSEQYQQRCHDIVHDERNKEIAEEVFSELYEIAKKLSFQSIYFIPYELRIRRALVSKSTILHIVEKGMQSSCELSFFKL